MNLIMLLSFGLVLSSLRGVMIRRWQESKRRSGWDFHVCLLGDRDHSLPFSRRPETLTRRSYSLN